MLEWSGFGQLVAESQRESGSDRVEVRARMLTIWDDVDNLFWDFADAEVGEDAPGDA